MRFFINKNIYRWVMLIILTLSTSVFAAEPRYSIFVDAGSSGSRLFVFSYETDAAIPTIATVFSASVNPGLSSYAAHPEQAGPGVKKIFDSAAAYLQSKGIEQSQVPVSIMATAGMRLIPESEQQAIYQAVNQFLATNYTFPVKEVKTITGQMEALYGWLDVNYLYGTFQKHLPTVGSLDVGGASAEIAFATDIKNIDPQDFVTINVGNQSYTVFAISYLGLGQDQLRNAMDKDPGATACYPQLYSLADGRTGNFNMQACGEIYKNLILEKITRRIPATQGISFIAYSGIYYDYTFFDPDTQSDMDQFEDQIQAICSQTWADMKKQFPTVPDKYLATDCANGVYIDRLIYSDYHLVDEQLTISNQINHEDIDWVLGAALYSLLQK